MMPFFNQVHGYKNGHQLLGSTIDLGRIDQDTVDRLSDISGSVRPGELFQPYFTCYPLPSFQFFVVARTWQDLNVQRAGCVVTKSIIVPINTWQNLNDITFIFRSLKNATPDKNEGISLYEIPQQFDTNIIQSPVYELVEALFLENRQPIVMFNSVDAEDIAIRLYSIFWASLKKSFSVCTFALAQRSIAGKAFDLLFAPESVKSRFSEWQGRRIDASIANAKGPRHRWSLQLANRIFFSNTPSLFADQFSDHVAFNTITDESTLRLSLLWNELMQKAEAEASPMAILGLLDIINSQPVFTNELYKNLEPYIFNAIQTASKKLSIEYAWRFFGALLSKHNKKLMSRNMFNAVRDACSTLTNENPIEALKFIQDNSGLQYQIPPILIAAFGDGVAISFENNGSYSILANINPLIGAGMLANSKMFCSAVISPGKTDLVHQLFLAQTLEININKEVIKAKKNISTFITSETHFYLLTLLYKNCNTQLYKDITNTIAKNTGFSIRHFDNLIIDQGLALYQLDFLVDLIISYAKKDDQDLLLIKIVLSERGMLIWLLKEDQLDDNRKSDILKTVLKENFDGFVDLISKSPDISQTIFDLLSFVLPNPVNLLVNILIVGNFSLEYALGKLNQLDPSAINVIESMQLTRFLIRVIADLSKELEREKLKLLNNVYNADFSYLLDGLTSRRYSPNEIVSNLRLLLMATSPLRTYLQQEADFVSRILTNNLDDYIDNQLSISWLTLLKSIETNQELQRKTAASILEFCYRCNKFDPTNLIAQSFPIVYRAFLSGKSITHFSPFNFFSDWDRCKTLREDLVHRYVQSSWSRLGLFKVAEATDILNEIISLLSNKKGRKFINETFQEIELLNIAAPESVKQALENSSE